MTLRDLVRDAHANGVRKGFWGRERELLYMTLERVREAATVQLALIGCEVSAAIEVLRTTGSWLPASEHVPEISALSEELADIIIRVCDLAGAAGIDLERAVALKMQYNAGRKYRHGKAF